MSLSPSALMRLVMLSLKQKTRRSGRVGGFSLAGGSWMTQKFQPREMERLMAAIARVEGPMLKDLPPPLDRKRPLNSRERRAVYSHKLKIPSDLNGQGRIAEHLLKGLFYEANLLVHIWQADIPGIYLDVGANVGNHMAFFAHKTHASHVFAFEPVCEHVGSCLDIARLNGFQHKVSVVPFAVSDEPGMVNFTYQLLDHYPKRTAAAVRLDDVVPPGVGLIKMDIEGGEPAALRGAKRILSEDRPALYIEAHDEAALAELMSVVRPFDYELTGAVFNASPTYEIVPREKLDYFEAIQSEHR